VFTCKKSAAKITLTALALVTISACRSHNSEIEGMKDLESYVAKNKIGADEDQWIEMRNMTGQWERVGLVFGFLGVLGECQNAIAGLKKINFAREYRCVPANSK
jgi:hypothetical protein